MLFVHVSVGLVVWIRVGCLCPPVRNDIVTPRHLFFVTPVQHRSILPLQSIPIFYFPFPLLFPFFFIPGAFKCETCEKRFKRKDYLDKHIISAHENKYTIITADAAAAGELVFSLDYRKR